MKKVLITGANSFVGKSLRAYLTKFPEDFSVSAVSVRDDSWKTMDFSGFDVIYHTAGIVHQRMLRKNADYPDLNRRVNTELPFAIAQKAKAEGVGQFIFLSTASVYGLSTPMGKNVVITETTPIAPKRIYSRSKWEAEKLLSGLSDHNFHVCILRPPMIYGAGCKGNYTSLSKFARILPVFPKVNNRRFMIYVDNLSELVRMLILDRAEGVYCPQNLEVVSTDTMVSLIAKANGKKVWIVPGFGWALKLLSLVSESASKAFGSLCYDEALRTYSREYCIVSLEESIRLTESKN